MKNLIPTSLFAVVLVCLFSQFIYSQDLRARAVESPLSTAFYLLSTTDKDSKVEEKACLTKSFARAEKFTELEKTVNLVEKDSYVDEDFISTANQLIEKGKTKEVSAFITFLIERFGDDEYRLQKVLKPLIRLKRDDEALQLIGKFDDSDKIDGAFEIVKIYLEFGQSEKALNIIKNITSLVEKSKYNEDKADLGLYYAKLDKEPEALRFLQDSMKNLTWKSGKPEYTEGRIIDKVVEIYRTLKKDKEADEILARQGIIEEPETQIEISRSYFAEGNLNKAKEILEKILPQLNLQDYSDSFDVGRLIEIYLKLGEINKAENLTKKLTGNDYLQQKYLLDTADFYIKKKNKSMAFELLNFALEKTKKIDTSEEESSQLWTSGKWKQAQYQSQIAIRLIDMQFDKEALQLISQINKPYLRALILTEFVSVNKKRISSKKLSSYLEEALSLLRLKKTDIFDSKRYDVYAITARNFAGIGMKEKAIDVFAEALTSLDKSMIESGSDSSLLFAVCNIGVEFEKSQIKTNDKLKASLRNIIKNWENDEY
jgi:thioredoxin-like negative regulator of GroEL